MLGYLNFLTFRTGYQPRNKSVLVAIYLRLGKPQKSIWSLSEGIGSMLILNISPKWPLNGIKIEKWPKYDLNMMSIWLPYTIYRRLSADLFHQCTHPPIKWSKWVGEKNLRKNQVFWSIFIFWSISSDTLVPWSPWSPGAQAAYLSFLWSKWAGEKNLRKQA